MSALWTHKSAQAACGGEAVGEWSVTGLSIDTRSLKEGDLFVPLKDIRDGHDFIPTAYEKGASAVLSERNIEDAPSLIVGDTLGALRDLAIAARTRSTAKRIAVTGSVGKTSVKEMIAHVCREFGKTHASIKSFNNHWGVPLTLAGMTQDTKYGIFEMGMNHAGELANLTKIVRPDIAVITNIAPAHLAHFKDVKAIAQAKSEILGGVVNGGIAILPRDSSHYELLAKSAKRVASFGRHEQADARIIESQLTPEGSRSILSLYGRRVEVILPLAGKHWVDNAACVLLIAYYAGLKLDETLKALKTMYKISGRGEKIPLLLNGNTVTLIDESYNANPASMGAAIATLGLYQGRKIAVLGDMLELGKREIDLHKDLAGNLKTAEIDQVMCCGNLMKTLHDTLPKPMQAGWHKDANSCLKSLEKNVQDNDTIMIKGSNASGMGKLVAALSIYAKDADSKGDTDYVL